MGATSRRANLTSQGSASAAPLAGKTWAQGLSQNGYGGSKPPTSNIHEATNFMMQSTSDVLLHGRNGRTV